MRRDVLPGEQIAARGYAFFPRLRPELPSATVFAMLGSIDAVEGFGEIQILAPHQAAESTPNTYSGNFGTGEFPLHTDLAHWAIPPRYVVLRCISGSKSVSTRILDGSTLVKQLGKVRLRRTLVQPRRPLRNGRQLLRLLERVDSADLERLRWDSIFLIPSNAFAASVVAEVRDVLACAEPLEISLEERGDTLVLDNWRLLHGRSPITEGGLTRLLNRGYLEVLH